MIQFCVPAADVWHTRNVGTQLDIAPGGQVSLSTGQGWPATLAEVHAGAVGAASGVLALSALESVAEPSAPASLLPLVAAAHAASEPPTRARLAATRRKCGGLVRSGALMGPRV